MSVCFLGVRGGLLFYACLLHVSRVCSSSTGAALLSSSSASSICVFCLLLAVRARVMVLVLSVQTVVNGHACTMMRLRILRPLFVAFWLIQRDCASYSAPLGFTNPFEKMADAQPKRRAARERREEQAEATRNVRARVDAIETRADLFDLRLRQLDVRVQYIEQPHRWVLRGFDCTKLFFQTMENNYAVAKGGFLAALIQEIRDHTAPACEALIEELETHLLEHNGLVMIGLYRTGGVTNDCPDSLLRLQQGLCGSKVSYFLNSLSRQLTEPLILHMDRVRKELAQGKGKGKGGDNGGRGKGRGKGRKGKQPQ